MNRTTLVVLVFLLTLFAPAATAQAEVGDVDWINDFRFYGDNTEHSGPYREGETILGGQILSFFRIPVGERVTILAGGFADFQSGDDDTVSDSLPILSFRYKAGTRTTFILGTLETKDRHGLVDPFQVSTLELTRPVETGLQMLSGGKRWNLDLFINWQKLNTSEHREAFDYGIVTNFEVGGGFSLDAQVHGYHEGGQLFAVGEVYNNANFGGGVSWRRELPALGRSGVEAMYLFSKTTELEEFPERPNEGDGVFVRLFAKPWSRGEVWGILWTAEDYFTVEGDHNYGSLGFEDGVFRPERDYKEIGAIHEFPIGAFLRFTVEGRLHWIDDDSPEVSWRVYARVPVEFRVWKKR